MVAECEFAATYITTVFIGGFSHRRASEFIYTYQRTKEQQENPIKYTVKNATNNDVGYKIGE